MGECKNGSLASIVVPVYNSAKFIADTIRTVYLQTYENWELILVDDASSDDSLGVINNMVSKLGISDKVRIIDRKKNGGAAKTRNAGIRAAKGRFLCFLDADDLWAHDKLARQVDFMREKECAFSFTGYEFADEDGEPNGKIVRAPARISYKQALKNTTIWTSTVIFDMEKLSVQDVLMPDVQRGQDTATWWKVLKKVECAYGLDEVLSYYRRSAGSLSSNKLTALKRTWNLYRNVEHLGFCRSCECFVMYCFNAARRRM